MKTNPAAHRIVRARAIIIGLAFCVMIGIAFRAGNALVPRTVRTVAAEVDVLPAPNWGPADLVAAAR